MSVETSANPSENRPTPRFMRIPIGKLWPNPKNPRKFKKPGAVEAKMNSMRSIGQKTPIKTWTLSEAEKAEIAKDLGGVCPYEHGVVGGHLRLEAAQRLGWATLDALDYDLTPAQILLEAFMDNEEENPHWLDRYQGIEDIQRFQPGVSQEKIAAQLGIDQTTVSRILRLMDFLNDKAKEAIYGVPVNAPKTLRNETPYEPGITDANLWDFPEKVAYAMLGLDGVSKTSPEDRDLIARALSLARKVQMTEAQAKGLVKWVKEGNRLEDYETVKEPKGKAPKGFVPGIKKYDQVKHIRIDTSRVSVNPYTPYKDFTPEELQRKVLSMQATSYEREILVRTLSEEEKEADPAHDYEVFDDPLVLEAAKRLGRPTIAAAVFPTIDVWEAIKVLNELDRLTKCSTWIEGYWALERLLGLDPKGTVAEKAIKLELDPVLAKEVYPAFKLLNKDTRIAIIESIRNCHEGRTDNGGYRFTEWQAIPLKRLDKLSKDLEETQKIVERVVNVAIANEMWVDEMEKLVDWVWDGNEPEEYFVEEA